MTTKNHKWVTIVIDGKVYEKCDECKTYYDSKLNHYNDVTTICEACSSNFGYCDNCSEFVHEDEMEYVEEKDLRLCESCLELIL